MSNTEEVRTVYVHYLVENYGTTKAHAEQRFDTWIESLVHNEQAPEKHRD